MSPSGGDEVRKHQSARARFLGGLLVLVARTGRINEADGSPLSARPPDNAVDEGK